VEELRRNAIAFDGRLTTPPERIEVTPAALRTCKHRGQAASSKDTRWAYCYGKLESPH